MVHGSDAAVPALAKLLADEKLASWARIPLEVIPGAAADEALRKAIDTTQGKLLVGVINSSGVRRDNKAVDPLAAKLTDKDAEVASAAAVALGNIGGAAGGPAEPAAIERDVARAEVVHRGKFDETGVDCGSSAECACSREGECGRAGLRKCARAGNAAGVSARDGLVQRQGLTVQIHRAARSGKGADTLVKPAESQRAAIDRDCAAAG